MANTTFSGPVRSEAGFQVATKNNTTGAFTTRYSSALPDYTGLTAAALATGAAITLINNQINTVNYTGAAVGGATLPTATAGKLIYVSNATGASLTGSLCFGNGTNFVDVTTGAVVA